MRGLGIEKISENVCKATENVYEFFELQNGFKLNIFVSPSQYRFFHISGKILYSYGYWVGRILT